MSEKNETWHAELKKGVEAATSSYSAAGSHKEFFFVL